MDKEEPNFNIWGEIFDSELVLEAAKVEQIYEKQQEKRRFAQLENDDLQQLVAGAEAKSTQKNTKWAIKTIQGNFTKQKLSTFLFHKKVFDCNNEFIKQSDGILNISNSYLSIMETLNKWLASIVYANVQDIFLFSQEYFLFRSSTFVLRIILESFKLHYFFLTSNTCDEYFAVQTQIRSDASSC